jgi:preflagellin peptidase FlaK
VETEEMLGISAFIITMAVLVSASVSDWRKREISDTHWMALGVIGLIMLASYSVHLTGFRWEYACLAAGTAMILLDIFWEKEFNPLLFYPLLALLFIVPLYGNMQEDVFRAWASVPLCYLIFLGMYVLGIVRGGADAKCLIVLSVMFPFYPRFFGAPLIGVPDPVGQIFVFSVSVLFIAAMAAIPAVAYFVARNAREGGFSKKMFSGYRMPVSQAENAHVWPLEDIVDGEPFAIKIPKEDEIADIYLRLKEAGHEAVWVTPMIPFVIMITAATAAVALIGNPLFLIF